MIAQMMAKTTMMPPITRVMRLAVERPMALLPD